MDVHIYINSFISLPIFFTFLCIKVSICFNLILATDYRNIKEKIFSNFNVIFNNFELAKVVEKSP